MVSWHLLCVLSSLLCDIYNLNLITYRSRAFICLCCSWKNSLMRFFCFFSIGATSNLLFWILVSTSHMLYHFIVLASCLYLSKLVDFVYNCTIIEWRLPCKSLGWEIQIQAWCKERRYAFCINNMHTNCLCASQVWFLWTVRETFLIRPLPFLPLSPRRHKERV